MKLIIAGGRDFTDLPRMSFVLSRLTKNNTPSCIICGMAKGADLTGRDWAIENSIPIEEFPANWDEYGKAAGYIRNEEMAKAATHCVCFWDGKSRGTGHMIDLAKKHNLQLRVIKY